MPASKFAQVRKSPAVKHFVNWLTVAGLAGALGATLGLGALRLMPAASAEIAGILACPAQAAAVAEVQALEVKTGGQRAWTLKAPQLRCTASSTAKGLTQSALTGRWYAAFAAWAVTAASLGYAALAVAATGAPSSAKVRAHRGVISAKTLKPEEVEEDYPAQFLAECCDTGARKRMTAAELHAAYAAWCRAKGQRPLTRKALTRDWRRLGLKPRGLFNVKAWRGVELKEQM